MSPMNDVIKAIMERYSCRDFTGEPLTGRQVEILAKAALAAPSALNLQPWHVIAVTDKSMLDEYGEECLSILKGQRPDFYQLIMDRGGKVFYNAPCMLMIVKDESEAAPLDCGIAIQNIALAAHSMGLGNVICGLARVVFTGPNADKWVTRLKIPQGYSFGMSILVGMAKSGKEPHELDLNKLTYVKG